MDLTDAMKKADQILDEERLKPTVNYEGTPSYAAFAAAASYHPPLDVTSPLHLEVDENPGRSKFRSINYDLLCAILDQMREEDRPQLFGSVRSRVLSEKSFHHKPGPVLTAGSSKQCSSELPLVCELCVRRGDKQTFLRAVGNAFPSPALTLLLMQLQKMIAFDFTLFSDQEYTQLSTAIRCLGQTVLGLKEKPKPASTTEANTRHYVLKEVSQLCDSVIEVCRKARYLYAKGALIPEVEMVAGTVSSPPPMEVRSIPEPIGGNLADLKRIAEITFRTRAATLYDDVIRDNAGLVDQHSKEGTASTPKFFRKAADAVAAKFQIVERLFVEVYIGEFEGSQLAAVAEPWLRESARTVVESQVARAQLVTRQLCSCFVGGAQAGYTAYIATLGDEGRTIQERLNEAITVLLLKSKGRADHAPATRQNPASKDIAQMPESNLLVLISHSSKDVELAQALIDLLRAGLGLQAHQIRCSSVDGYRLPVGVDTEDKLREEVNAAKVVVGLITPNSLASAYVMFELGARWGARRFLAPLLAGVDPDDLGGPLRPLNALSCTEAQLHQLLGDLANQLGLSRQPPESYIRFIMAVVQRANATSPHQSKATSSWPNVVFSHCRLETISLDDPEDGATLFGTVVAEFFNDVSEPTGRADGVVAHLVYFKRPDSGKPLGDPLWLSRQGVWQPGPVDNWDFEMNGRGRLLVGLIVREDNTKAPKICAVGFRSPDNLNPFGMETFDLEERLPVTVHVTLRGAGFQRKFGFVLERSRETYVCEQLPTPA